MKYIKQLAVFLLILISFSANAGEWRTGFAVSYLSGVDDVVDIYESNLEAMGYTVDSTGWPIGIAFDGHYEWDSGLRVGVGIGPISAIISDEADHFEIAANATIGYTFIPSANISPYVKVGIAYHAIDGDYVVSEDPGVLAAVGIDFSRNNRVMYSFEIAKDDSEATFERYGAENETINTYDTIVSFIVKF